MYTHLRSYSTYSIGYGAMQVEEYVNHIKSLGMSACALTETGVLYSAIEFYKTCKKEEIKPIIGMDISIQETEGIFHALVLALNEDGYFNLIKLNNAMQRNRVDGKPVATLEDLEAFGRRGNVVIVTGHRTSKFGLFLLRNRMDEAVDIVHQYQEWFGSENVYLEVQHHGQQTDATLTARVMAESRRLGIPAILTNQTLYATPETSRKHVLIRGVLEQTVAEKIERSVIKNCHIRSHDEMAALYPNYPELINNTEALTERVQLELDLKKKYHPKAIIPEGETEMSYLKKQVKIGFKKRYGHLNRNDPYAVKRINQLAYELPIIEKTGYAGYLLIVSDFIREELSLGHYVGFGRGSGAGSLTLACLDITNVDPVEWGLLFERFLNLDRVSDPDIDTDFMPEFREGVVQYCIRKYGADRVASIITFGTMAARAAIRDAGRVTGAEPHLVDRIAKMVPKKPGVTLNYALGRTENADKIKEFYTPELEQAYMDNADVKSLIDDALLLEGLVRNTGVHAAGKIISSVSIGDVCPLQYDEETGGWITQFDGPTCEAIGLMKMDFLGLDTLSIMKRTIAFIKMTTGKDIDLRDIPYDDEAVFREIYSKGRTVAVFQFESAGMRRMLQEFQPRTMEDIILLNAAYRPGPIQFLDAINENKNNPDKIVYDTPAFEPILAETYGKPVYQEQIMKLFTIAGYSLGEADIIRRAMAKKKDKELVKHKPRFLKACMELGMPEERTEPFWNEIMEFARYAFNKSHAAAYSINSYFTAWLKLHYPAEFMAAAMSIQKLEKIPGLIQESRLLGLELLKPDINQSDVDFTPEPGAVRFGLGRMKGVASAAARIVEERNANGAFKSLTDFIQRVQVPSNVMKALIAGGALDSFGYTRSGLDYLVERDWKTLQDTVKKLKKDSNQLALFDTSDLMPEVVVPQAHPWGAKEQFQREFAVLQAYVDGHPTDAFKVIRTKDMCYLSDLVVDGEDEQVAELDKQEVQVMVLIDEIQELKRKSDNTPMGRLKVSDGSGSMTAMLFTKSYAKNKDKIVGQEVRILKGRYSYDENDPQLIVEEILVPTVATKYYVKVPSATRDWGVAVAQVAKQHIGQYPLYIFVDDERKVITAKQTVAPSFYEDAVNRFGEVNVAMMG